MILLPIKSLLASAVASVTLLDVVLSAPVAGYLASSRAFWLDDILHLKF